jgi:hypothetical protein
MVESILETISEGEQKRSNSEKSAESSQPVQKSESSNPSSKFTIKKMELSTPLKLS